MLDHRPEKIQLGIVPLQAAHLRKIGPCWMKRTNYVDPRDPQHATRKLHVVFLQPDMTFGKAETTALLQELDLDHVIVVCRTMSNHNEAHLNQGVPPHRKQDQDTRRTVKTWEVLYYRELEIMILSSVYVPPHRVVCDAKERERVIHQVLKLTPQTVGRLNKILARKDAVARLLGLRSGDLVEIHQGSIITGIDIDYRIVT